MDFENKMPEGFQDEPSIDELIADAKRHIASEAGSMQEEFQPQADYGMQEPMYAPQEPMYAPQEPIYAPQEPMPQEFEPDFGDAFADYGTYAPEVYANAPQEPYYEAPQEEQDGPAPKKPKRNKKKRIVPLFVKVLLYLVLVGVAAVGLGYGVWECAQDVLAFGRSEEALTVVVNQGDDVADIADMLHEKGVIKYPWLFKLYCKFTDSENDMDPGTYEIFYNYDYHALVSGMMKRSPNRVEVRVTIPEGYTAAQIFALMEKNKVCTVAQLEECSASYEFDYWFLEDVPYGKATRLEGFLFPDTYDFYESDDPERVLDKLLTNFDKKFSENAIEQLELLNTQLAERWTNAGMDEAFIAENRFTVHDLVIVASMIEKETSGVTESGKIASVIYNRLCKPSDFPCLQIDATVVYALGGVDHALTYEDLEVDSPYNTYKYSGLPIGPISNPGLSSITAALNPSDTDYYYYVLDNSTGTHHFSETLAEHERFLEEQNNG